MPTTPLSTQDEFELVDPAQDVRGWKVQDFAGNDVGIVEEMLVDTGKERVTILRLDTQAEYWVRDVEIGEQVIVLGLATQPRITAEENAAAHFDPKDELRLPGVKERLRVSRRSGDLAGIVVAPQQASRA